MNNERLYINDQLVDEVIRRSLLSCLKPMSFLKQTFADDEMNNKVALLIAHTVELDNIFLCK